MPVFKRKYRSRRIAWAYEFDLPGATREERVRVSASSGFSSKKEAGDAEVARRLEQQQERDLPTASLRVTAPRPKTLSMLLEEFFRQHVDPKLAPKTVERYHEQSSYIHTALLRMPIAEISPLHLNREWDRLLNSGGHTRRDKMARPLSAKTVRNIAGILSSAFTRAIKWGLVAGTPSPTASRRCRRSIKGPRSHRRNRIC